MFQIICSFSCTL